MSPPTPPRVQVRGPGTLIAVLPYLLGFHPADILVIIGIAGPRAMVRLAFRYHLPDPPDPALTADIADHAASVMQRENITTVAGDRLRDRDVSDPRH